MVPTPPNAGFYLKTAFEAFIAMPVFSGDGFYCTLLYTLFLNSEIYCSNSLQDNELKSWHDYCTRTHTRPRVRVVYVNNYVIY